MSCLLVVCIHVSNVYSRAFGEISNTSYLLSLFANGFSRVAVPIFFMISGYLLLNEPPGLRKSVHRVLHTIVVLVFWSIVYYFWDYYYLGEEYNFCLIFEEPVKKHLWFLYAILGMYISQPFFQYLFCKMPKRLMEYFVVLWLFFLTFNYVLALLHIDFAYPVPLVGTSCYLGYFALGYILRRLSDDFVMKTGQCYGLSAVASVTTIVITYLYSLDAGEHIEVFFQYRNVLIALSSVLLFFGVMQRDKRRFSEGQKAAMGLISRHSFTIYLSHILFLDLVKENLHPIAVPAWLGIPAFTVGILAVTLGFSILADGCLGFAGRLPQLVRKKIRVRENF